MKCSADIANVVFILFMLAMLVFIFDVVGTPRKYESENPCRDCERLGFICSDPYLFMRYPSLLNLTGVNFSESQSKSIP